LPRRCDDGRRSRRQSARLRSVNDNSTSSPVVAPDGSVYYGTYTRYNHSQGHTVRFSATGEFLASYQVRLGCDAGDLGARRNVLRRDEGEPLRRPARVWRAIDESYFITQLSPDLDVEWRYESTNTLRAASATGWLDCCVDDHPLGFEWCVNALAVDARGVVYVNSEDGSSLRDQSGRHAARSHLPAARPRRRVHAAVARRDGKIYTQNAGQSVRGGLERATPPRHAALTSLAVERRRPRRLARRRLAAAPGSGRRDGA
jgi:outer membrane protein assembly factor BamB